jgi:aminocarboxymuconate-semialdehyde decarboxylase
MKIDIDSHIFPEAAVSTLLELGFKPHIDKYGKEWMMTPNGHLRQWGKLYYDLDVRRPVFKEAGFDKQVLICDQGFAPDFVPLEFSSKIFRAYNEAIAKIEQQDPDFIGCADVPHQDPDVAIAEAERAVKDLGLRAIRVYGSWSGKNIESEDWLPFFETVSRLDVPLLFHPHGAAGKGQFNPNLLGKERLQAMGYMRVPTGEVKPVWAGAILAFPHEALVFASGLILHGILEKYPNLKICMLECGVTWATYLADRLDALRDQVDALRGEDPDFYGSYRPFTGNPSRYLKSNFWFTLDHVGEAMVPYMIREMGMARRLLAQTDFPHPEGSLDIVRWVQSMDISEADKELILGKNAAALLRVT